MWLQLCLFTVLGVLVTACSSARPTPLASVALEEPEVAESASARAGADGYAPLLEWLEELGFEVSLGSTYFHPFLSVHGRTMMLNDERLQTFLYPNPEAAQAESLRFSRDGAWIDRAGEPVLINWIATPHLFLVDSMLIIYVGENAELLAALSVALDEPFAGGANPYSAAFHPLP
ncbi:MAG: hypothetical protein SNJ59_12065 [Aggregatilineales bacterium]